MGKRIRNITGGMPGTILSKGLGKSALLVFVLFFYSLYSQEGFGTPALISVKGNAQIYSTDPDFNQQFTAQENTDYRISNLRGGLVFKSKDLLAAKKPSRPKAKPSVQTADKITAGKIRKTVSDFEQRKKLFNFFRIDSAPFSRELPYSSDSSRAYVIPSTTFHDFSKACVCQCKLLISLVLERLYVGKYHCFNNRSFDFCFSELFSIRPPPVFMV